MINLCQNHPCTCDTQNYRAITVVEYMRLYHTRNNIPMDQEHNKGHWIRLAKCVAEHQWTSRGINWVWNQTGQRQGEKNSHFQGFWIDLHFRFCFQDLESCFFSESISAFRGNFTSFLVTLTTFLNHDFAVGYICMFKGMCWTSFGMTSFQLYTPEDLHILPMKRENHVPNCPWN